MVLKALLAFVYEGKCEIDERLLTDVLEASARLVVDALVDDTQMTRTLPACLTWCC